MKRPDMIVLIATWQFLSAIVPVIGVTAIFLFAMPFINDLTDIAYTGAMFGIVISIILLGAFAVISIAGGVGILTGKEWGRMMSIVQAALCLIGIPIGTIIGVLIINYLGKPEVKEYFTPIET